MSVIEAADLFCGAGGTSCGLMRAADALGLKVKLTAVNHWPRAVETHSRNHASARHLCAALSSIEPRKAVPSGRLRLLLASPECTHHSVARGGKPMNDQSRASAWHVLHWCEELRVDDVVIENVKEFQDWGPIGADGRPLKSRKGELFRAFINALKVTFKSVEWRVLNAADFGDATSRRRLFIRASRKPIVWPEPTHAAKWRAAREIIDWSIPGTSIFTRKRDLQANTLARIEAGFRMQGAAAEPFLVILRQNCDALSINSPLPTICAAGNHVGLAQPFMVSVNHGGGKERRVHDLAEPIPTMQCRGQFGLIQPFLVPQTSKGAPRGMDKPIPTVTTTSRGVGLVQPFLTLMANSSSGKRVRAVGEPLPTITTADEFSVVDPFLIQYYGQGQAQGVNDPIHTITGRDRYALITPTLLRVTGPDALAPFLIQLNGEWYWIDIRFRMLQPHELAAAMGFSKDYQFTGTREERVKQIGNAVAVNMAAALCRSVLEKSA